MKTIAVYNMKGGVGKTTTAVNLAYLAAESGQRTLLWDLDPQGASSFAFRVRPHVASFGKRTLAEPFTLTSSVKETDFENLYLLPADFSYHKLDRWLSSFGSPVRLFASILDTIGDEFDVVFLDCPAGFSRIIEGTFTAADAIVTPTIPAVLSLRMVARLINQAQHAELRSAPVLFFNMVDRRRRLHARACELARTHSASFLAAQVPYANIVEQLAARRMPLTAFAPKAPAAKAFGAIWREVQGRLLQHRPAPDEGTWLHTLQSLESMIEQLEIAEQPPSASRPTGSRLGRPAAARQSRSEESPASADHTDVVHWFDTDQRDLEHRGYTLELREQSHGRFVIVARSDAVGFEPHSEVEAEIGRASTVQVLCGERSPIDVLEERVRPPQPQAIALIRAVIGTHLLQRIEPRSIASPESTDGGSTNSLLSRKQDESPTTAGVATDWPNPRPVNHA